MPNAEVLKAKEAQVAEAVELIKSAQTGILVDYRGLNVAEDTELRNKLREANVKYFVIKNKILQRAVDEIGLTGLEEVLHGPTALAVSAEDAVAPAKVLADFAKGNEKLGEIFDALIGAIVKAKPSAAKGQYLRSVVVASTMGPGIKVNQAKLG